MYRMENAPHGKPGFIQLNQLTPHAVGHNDEQHLQVNYFLTKPPLVMVASVSVFFRERERERDPNPVNVSSVAMITLRSAQNSCKIFNIANVSEELVGNQKSCEKVYSTMVRTYDEKLMDHLHGQLQQERVCKCPQTPRGCNADLLVGRHVSLFQKFRKLHYDGQSQYLSQIISLQEPKRRRVEENISRRHCTVKYSINGTQVCRGTVCYIFSITPRRLQWLIGKLKANMNNLQDQRGKHLNRPKKLKNMDVGLISDHIRSFPLQENHYSRNTSAKQCLPADLNISKMFRLFKEKYPDANNISFRVYHDIFKSKFNLRFGLPRSDTCSYCDKLFMKLCSTDDANEKKKIEIESEIHHRKAEAGYKTLKDDTETSKLNPNYVVLCTDLQQVLFCPNLTHSSVFYQRQFSTYNYAVHNMGEENATMLLWHEAMEIASALLFYITNKYSRLKAGEERKLVVWSDRLLVLLTQVFLLVSETDKKSKAVCKFCCFKYAFPNATRMTNHILNQCSKCPLEIKQKYGNEIQSSSKPSTSEEKGSNKDILLEALEDTSLPSTSKKDTSSMSSSSKSPLPSVKRKKASCQQTLSGFFDKIAVSESSKIDEALARAIYASGAPFSLFKNKYWEQVFKMLRQSYQIPSPYAVSTNLLNSEYERVQINQSQKLSESDSLSIVTDSWRNIVGDGLINIVICTPMPLSYKTVHRGTAKQTGTNKEALQCTVFVENLNVKQNIKKVVLDDAFWQNLQYTKQILHPVSISINLVESDRSILSEVPFVFKYIKDTILDIPQQVDLTSSLIKSLLKCVEERYEFCSKPIHFAANLLDVRFKGEYLNEDQLMEAIDFISEMARSLNLDVRKVVANLAQFRTKTGFFSRNS
ncbi:unnamed protein product [Acanthoscelides obtectus]|uniref:BED-type domain-containing protein n=1 Tax=Acanthoscelides obtectus TaxID=200917 RepID=A0A9P0LQJ3_ACAOB|nr:unnamed protein product [Acanthoscelides obtectus]CAK1625763.1 hypothetical protein AOBTE_LOCUS3384 [Acanthoscelides obtectus]